jgi:hypothetical protein
LNNLFCLFIVNMIVKYARNVFIDSEINQVGNGEITKINFPPSVFSVQPSEQMKMILTSAEIRRNWYNINQHNNIIFWYDPTGPGSYTPIVIEPGNYTEFGAPATADTLVPALTTAINSVTPLVGTTVTYDKVKRKIVLDLTGAAGPLVAGSRFVSFQVKKTPNAPTGVNENAYFNDAHEIWGGYPTRDGWDPTVGPVDLFSGSTAGGAVATAQQSPFVAQLNTLEAVYIRTNLHSGNYQTYGFEKDLPNQKGLTPTQIFARIPLNQQYHTNLDPFVSFEDPNGLFSMYLSQTQLSQVFFSITDDKGRLLPEVNEDQAVVGSISFKLSFRWEVLHDELPPNDQRLKLDNLAKSYQQLAFNAKH